MAIRNDYILDMMARFVDAIMLGMNKAREGLSEESKESYCEVVGDVLDMDASTVLALSPESLVTMMQISAVDERLALYLVYALEALGDLESTINEPCARVRHQQAQAVAAAYGFDVGEVPPELVEALEEKDHK